MGILDNQVAVITGGAGGIGSAVAELFAKEGARLVVNDRGSDVRGLGESRDPADEVVLHLKTSGANAVASYADVTTAEGVDSISALAIEHFGRLDTWVHCAGVARDRQLMSLDPDDFAAVLNTLVQGTFHGLRAAARVMKKSGRGGRIVTTTGIAGFLGNYGQANYAAAAAAIYGLTRTASIELQRHAISVNAVAPIAKTRMTEDLPMFEHVDSMLPEHVAPAYLFLGSPLGADVSGVVLSVAGGKLSTYEFVESQGQFKGEGETWTASAIADRFAAITKR